MEFSLVGGLKTAVVSRSDLAKTMLKDCLEARSVSLQPKVVFSSNGQGVALAAQSETFKKTMETADIIHADGQSLVFASKLFCKKPLPERVATTDFFHDAAEIAESNGLSFFILGSKEEENLKAVQEMQRMYPNLKVVGRHHGYFERDSKEEDEVIEMINSSKADVLWVALGKPNQEYWCERVKARLNVGWIKTCGGLYEFLSGNVSRAPEVMQKLGLEWLYRTSQDPKRLLWRYLTTNPLALYKLVTKSK
ncbi:WecB/TagA/CpsF family glycosyltransferase [Alteromonas sp. KUL49]|uniref:WecB/TagA/CpsF family glycosyltransferase n=1 Tax=Alteromonas sp. KUL49 TaxID=2480798 RepID=UPI00102EE506|nr:WecB/TagA/CpsF family glycosyltransferase [Alteromonas sp. KUL49]TAP40326.1 glycosyltransferase [Alteromonas sp. KUL49]GEA11471.1 UDP-N-acetyl-D-mannosamine transferase [Alteromonas sp. KUL49]